MKITNEAVAFLKTALEEEQTQSIRIVTEAGCCGPTLGLAVATPEETDEVSEFDGLTFAVANDARSLSENVTLDVESTEDGLTLVLHGLQPSC
ncbi:iron-sulfur cluster biosynthesis family protein [Exiguobacterium qingdaonense]|uniref:iron-sulfur cluster biosynthesis family protein n=1 Tax=Exiguobacterium qingdaonense TaxID=2751251 RepID=UPI001BE7FCAE|nr:iron-sulfur cluster biosynthesis family protein [Exiguobacterium qingdaonense]